MIRPVMLLSPFCAMLFAPRQAVAAKQKDHGLRPVKLEQAFAHAKAREAMSGKRAAGLLEGRFNVAPHLDFRGTKAQKRILIATAMPLEPSPVSARGVSPEPVVIPSASARHGDITDRAEKLAARIEMTCRAEMTDRPQQGDVWRYTLVNDVNLPAHIHGIEIALSGSALDVALLRENAMTGSAYLAAAQHLAEALQKRFGTRVVRIHETTEARATDMRHTPKIPAKGKVAR